MTHHAIGVVGHAKRIDEASTLADKVGAKVLTVDPGRLGAGKNHLRAWRQLYNLFPDSRWLVVLEDDAVPVGDFNRQLRLALDAAPSPIVSLYLGRYRPGHWQPSIAKAFGMIDPAIHDDPPDPCWFTGMPLLHAVGVAIKTSLVPLMVDYLPWHLRAMAVDEAMSRWASRRGAEVAYTMPSLVDHNYRLPTLIPERTSIYGEVFTSGGDVRHDCEPRKAWRTGTRDSWNSSMLHVPAPDVADLTPEAYVIL